MKQFLAFLAGLLGGATAGYFVTKKVYGESYERDLEDIRAYYDEEVKKLKEEKVTVEEEVKTNNKKKTTKADTDIKDAAKELSKDEERVDYSGISTEKTKKSATKTTKSKKKEPDILIIDADEFRARDGRIKETLTYFPQDDRFVDQYNEDIEAHDLVGSENLDKFDGNGELYIRNNKNGVDYEVLSEASSYEEYMEDFR